MRKIGSLFVMVLIVLALSGCDLISSETIEKATEELCRENPENELCQSDALANLEETVVLDLFNSMLSTAKETDDADADAYCDTYISITNVELLDSCRADISSLFPEGMENFEVESVTIEGDEYIILLSSLTDAEKLKFTLQTKVDGTSILINEWSFTEAYISEPGIYMADVVSLIDMFIADMENEMLTDDQVCALWDGIDDDCDGIEDARRKFKAGASLSKTVNIIESEDPTGDDTRFTALIEFTLEGHVTVLKVSFTINLVDSELQITIVDPDADDDNLLDVVEGIEKDEIKRIIELFVADFIDASKTDLEVCEIWYDGIDDDCNRIMEQRIKFRAGSDLDFVINIHDDDSDGDGILDAEVSFNLDGHVTVLKISVQINPNTTELELIIIESDVEGGMDMYLTADEALVFFNEFVVDYLNPMVTFEELNMKYFNNEMEMEFNYQRTLDLEDGLVVNVLTTTSPVMNEEGFFIIEVEFIIDGSTLYQEITIKPIRLDLAIIINFGGEDEYNEEVFELLEIEALWDDFVEDYLDPTITDEELNMMYFNGMMDPVFMDTRLLDLERGITINTSHIAYSNNIPGPYFDIEIDITVDGMVSHEKIKIRVNRIDMALYISFEDMDNYMEEIDNTEINTFIENFINDVNDTSILVTHVCHLSIDTGIDDDCDGLVDGIREGGYTIGSGEVEDLGNAYIIEFIFTSEMEMFSEFYNFYFYYNDDMMLVAEIYQVHMDMEIFGEVMMLFEGLNEFTIPVEEACMFVHDDSLLRCTAIRDYHVTNNYNLMVTEMYINEDMNNVVVVTTYDDSGIFIEENIFFVFYTMNMDGINQIHVESTIEGNNPLYE